MRGEDLSRRLERFWDGGREPPVELARLLLDDGRAADALAVSKHALPHYGDDATELMVVAARAYRACGDALTAEALLIRAARAAPDRASALFWLGDLLEKRGAHARAVQVLERAHSLEPDDEKVEALLAKARASLRASEEAEQAPARAREDEPHDTRDPEALDPAPSAPAPHERVRPRRAPRQHPQALREPEELHREPLAKPTHDRERLMRARLEQAQREAERATELAEREGRLAAREARLAALEAHLVERIAADARWAARAEVEARRAEAAARLAERAADAASRFQPAPSPLLPSEPQALSTEEIGSSPPPVPHASDRASGSRVSVAGPARKTPASSTEALSRPTMLSPMNRVPIRSSVRAAIALLVVGVAGVTYAAWGRLSDRSSDGGSLAPATRVPSALIGGAPSTAHLGPSGHGFETDAPEPGVREPGVREPGVREPAQRPLGDRRGAGDHASGVPSTEEAASASSRGGDGASAIVTSQSGDGARSPRGRRGASLADHRTEAEPASEQPPVSEGAPLLTTAETPPSGRSASAERAQANATDDAAPAAGTHAPSRQEGTPGRGSASPLTTGAEIEGSAALPERLLARATSAVRARNPQEADFHLRRLEYALRRDHRPASFRMRVEILRARAHLMEGRRADARTVLSRVIRDPEAPPEAFFHFAQSQVGYNRRAAQEAFERYLELEPQGRFAPRARLALQASQP